MSVAGEAPTEVVGYPVAPGELNPALAPVATGIEATRSQRIPARMVLILGAMSFFGPLCIDMYLPALPAIARDLHTPASAVQVSLTSCLIGMAVGQILVGTISDRAGRRTPLLIGLIGFILASVGCALAPNILALIGLRFVQGIAGSAGIVICRAIVRDLYSGPTAARFFSLLTTVTALGPIIAPQIGAGVLQFGSWRLVFVAFCIAGTLLLGVAVFLVPETLPPERRHTGGASEVARALRSVGTNRNFLVNALAVGLGSGALFGYISGSSFVLEEVHGLSPQQYGLAFALNAVGLLIFSQISARSVGRLGSFRLLTIGLSGFALASFSLLLFVATGWFGLPAVLVCLFALLSSHGLVLPNAMTLALHDFPHAAGTASALLGVLMFTFGAIAAPLVGLGGSHTALPMAIVMASFAGIALTVRLALSR